MATAAFHDPGDNPTRRILTYVGGGLLLLAALWFIYSTLTTPVNRRVDPDRTVTAAPDLLPPPPPPPPPPPEPVETPPEPTETPVPQEAPTPAPTPDAPAPMQIDGPAQAGTDAFGMKSGSGGGLGAIGGTGSCVGTNCGGGAIGDAFYARYMSTTLERAVRRDRRLNRKIFQIRVAIWIAGGRISRATLLSPTGDKKIDDALMDVVTATANLQPPPANLKFPQRITVRGSQGS